jgi:hypothetical protein
MEKGHKQMILNAIGVVVLLTMGVGFYLWNSFGKLVEGVHDLQDFGIDVQEGIHGEFGFLPYNIKTTKVNGELRFHMTVVNPNIPRGLEPKDYTKILAAFIAQEHGDARLQGIEIYLVPNFNAETGEHGEVYHRSYNTRFLKTFYWKGLWYKVKPADKVPDSETVAI